ncbi:MAG: hypothetical protein WAW31_15630 [Smithella sp.]
MSIKISQSLRSFEMTRLILKLSTSEFKCKRIDKKDLWSIADDIRNTYWPEGRLPVDIEKIVEFRLTRG